MKDSFDKKIDSMMLQINSLNITNDEATRLRKNVIEELKTLNNSNKDSKSQHRELKRMLHATRTFDSGLRMFLEQHGGFKGDMPSIGGYVTDLQHKRKGLKQLDGVTATRIKKDVTDVRNKYMHTANSYPSKNLTDDTMNKILQYYTMILNLANK